MFPESLTKIGNNAFKNCVKLENVLYGENNNITYGTDVFENTKYKRDKDKV